MYDIADSTMCVLLQRQWVAMHGRGEKQHNLGWPDLQFSMYG